MSGSDEGIGGRFKGWSRRKLEAKRQEAAVPAPPMIPEAVEPVAPEPTGDEAEIVAALPPLDAITAGFDISPFLAKGVPTSLKNAALRRLWSASPAVRDYLDPAVDYAWDWNAPGGVPGGGGILSESSVAKMVKDLIGTRSDPESEATDSTTARPDTDVEDVPVEAGAPDLAEHENPSAVRRKETPKNNKKQTQAEVRVADAAAQLPLRRHGGAVPQ